jgi:predicted secreted Zn-dependent protease
MISNPTAPAALGWHVARGCESGGCVGVARDGQYIVIGNTTKPEAPASYFSQQEWNVFVAGVKLGDFDDLG